MFIRAVVFDIDGTLVDHDTAARQAVLNWSRPWLGGPQADDRVRLWAALEAEHFARYLTQEIGFAEQRRLRLRGFFAAVGEPIDDELLDEQFSGYLREYEAAWTCFEDVHPALSAVSLRRLAVLSNGEYAQQVAKLARVGLSGCFEDVLTAGLLGIAKPAPEVFRICCERLGLLPSEVAYVGDDLRSDAVAATEAGLVGVWLNRSGRARPADTPVQMKVMGSLRELPELLSRIETGVVGGPSSVRL